MNVQEVLVMSSVEGDGEGVSTRVSAGHLRHCSPSQMGRWSSQSPSQQRNGIS